MVGDAAGGVNRACVGIAVEEIAAAPTGDRVVAAAAHDEVAADASVDRVVARLAKDGVVAAARRDVVVAAAGPDQVAARAGGDRVVAAAGPDPVVATSAHDRIAAAIRRGIGRGIGRCELIVAVDRIVAGVARDRVVARAADDDVCRAGLGHAVVGPGRKRVVARAAEEAVGAVATDDCVVAGAAPARIVAGVEQDVVVAAVAEDAVLIVAGVDLVVATRREIDRLMLGVGEALVGRVVAVAVDTIVASAAAELVGPEASPEAVIAVAAIERVGGTAAHENIVAIVAAERVHAAAADDRVVAIATRDVHGGGDIGGDRHKVVAAGQITLDQVDAFEDAHAHSVRRATGADHRDAAAGGIAGDLERVFQLGGDERDLAARLHGRQFRRGGWLRRRLRRNVEVDELLVDEDHVLVDDRLGDLLADRRLVACLDDGVGIKLGPDIAAGVEEAGDTVGRRDLCEAELAVAIRVGDVKADVGKDAATGADVDR